jgi:multiple sugar transport system ATP-binding protein
LQRQLGTTTVYVTHDQAEAMTLGHRVAVMNQGKLQQFDTPLTIYNEPANRFVAGFVGSPTMNFLDGEIDLANRRFMTRQLGLTLNGSQLETFRQKQITRATLGIRPENIAVSSIARESCYRASVYVTELMGSETFVILQLDGARLVARAPGDFRAEPDSHAWLEFDIERAHWFDNGGRRIV